jgi:lysyl-tRNA synthetase class 1
MAPSEHLPMGEALFWADRKAREVGERRRFHFLEEEVPEIRPLTVKTSASLSGALHIGRLSDTIRSDSLCRALRDLGYGVRFLWVAEDMDPFRKIPEGVPEEYREFIGTPVTGVPDPWECHASYAEHHAERYFEVLEEFTDTDLERFSMREEYRKGSFRPYIRALLENLEEVREILNRYRQKPLDPRWCPWNPLCERCGKIITPRVTAFEGGKVRYRCEDYSFETHVAEGCGYEGWNDPLEGEGKLMWKGEWASQWVHWRIVAEGAGKEYAVPTSAWWVNGELVERIFRFPMPVSLFYEHLLIDGKKMSASVGNVVYPEEWLRFAPPQLLRFFYNKKLMKTRSFSWRDLPRLYDEYDLYARVYHGIERPANEKEARHMERLYEVSQLGEVEPPNPLPFSHAVMVIQFFPEEEARLESLQRSGHLDEERLPLIQRRLAYAEEWATHHAPEDLRIERDRNPAETASHLDPGQKAFLRALGDWLEEGERSREEIQAGVFSLIEDVGIPRKRAFQGIYLLLLGKERGPKVGTLIHALGREGVLKRLREVLPPE